MIKTASVFLIAMSLSLLAATLWFLFYGEMLKGLLCGALFVVSMDSASRCLLIIAAGLDHEELPPDEGPT